jgi:hypothetical protein
MVRVASGGDFGVQQQAREISKDSSRLAICFLSRGGIRIQTEH